MCGHSGGGGCGRALAQAPFFGARERNRDAHSGAWPHPMRHLGMHCGRAPPGSTFHPKSGASVGLSSAVFCLLGCRPICLGGGQAA